MKKPFWIVMAGLALTAFAWAAQTTYKLMVNNQASSLPAIVVNGKTYVPLEALQKAGAKSNLSAGTLSLTLPGGSGPASGAAGQAAGGSQQLAALEGCVGETLFNGVWRFKVTKFEKGVVEGKDGWLLNVELRNGSKKPQYVYGTGLSNSNDGYTLAAPDGNTGIWQTYYILNDFATKTVPQAGLMTFQFKFWPSDSATPEQLAQTPTKFIMLIDGAKLGFKEYTVPDPSFRVKLDCKK